MTKKNRTTKYYSLERGGIKGNSFIVIETQSGEIVFTSLSRKNANKFIKHHPDIKNYDWGFGLNMPGKSLDYNFAYSPDEYQSTGLLFLLVSVAGFILVNSVFGGMLILISLFCFVQNIRSSKALKQLQLSS